MGQRNLKILSGKGPDTWSFLPWPSLSHNSLEGGEGRRIRGQVSAEAAGAAGSHKWGAPYDVMDLQEVVHLLSQPRV